MVETSRPNSPSLARYRAAISSIGIGYLARLAAMGRSGVDAMGRLIGLRMRQDLPPWLTDRYAGSQDDWRRGAPRDPAGAGGGRRGLADPEPIVGGDAGIGRMELLEEQAVLIGPHADRPDDVAPGTVEPPRDDL